MWIFGIVCGVIIIGFVAYKWSSWFGKADQAAANVVNTVDNTVKKDLNIP